MYQDNKNLDSLGLPPCDCTPDYDYPENPDWLWFFTEWQKIKDQIGDYPSLEKMIQENKKSINTLTDAQKDNVLKSLQAVKTMDMVQPVGIDTDGRLWVKPSSGGPAAVVSVNGKTGVVKLTAADVGALPADTPIPPAYNLPVASDTRLGGVRPETKTDDMSQPVGVDTSGRLFTAPGSGGSGPAYTLPIATQDKLGGVKASPVTPDQTEPVGIDAAGKLFTAPSKGGGGTGEKEVEVTPNTPLPNSVVLWVDPDEPAPLVNLIVDVESTSQGGYQANYTADDIRKYAQDNTVIELRYQSDRYRFDGMVDDYGPRQGMAQFSRIQIAPDDIDQLTIFVDDAGAVTTDNSVFEHNNSLGIMGAAVGDLARVKAVDSNGVPTVWEPVTMEDLEGKWEPIDEFTVPESMPFSKDMEPDGTPYNFKKVMIKMHMGPHNPDEGSQWGYILATQKSGSQIQTLFYGTDIHASKFGVGFIVPNSGYWEAKWSEWVETESLPMGEIIGAYSTVLKTEIGGNIIKIRSERNVAPGTVVTIRAVRA